MELVRHGEGLVRRPPVPDGPTVTVLFGGEPGGPDVGVVRLEVPAGFGMPEHVHAGSDVVVVPVAGSVVISKGTESVTVSAGDAALIRKDEAVALQNPGADSARVVVAAGPPHFVGAIRQWPQSGLAE